MNINFSCQLSTANLLGYPSTLSSASIAPPSLRLPKKQRIDDQIIALTDLKMIPDEKIGRIRPLHDKDDPLDNRPLRSFKGLVLGNRHNEILEKYPHQVVEKQTQILLKSSTESKIWLAGLNLYGTLLKNGCGDILYPYKGIKHFCPKVRSVSSRICLLLLFLNVSQCFLFVLDSDQALFDRYLSRTIAYLKTRGNSEDWDVAKRVAIATFQLGDKRLLRSLMGKF